MTKEECLELIQIADGVHKYRQMLSNCQIYLRTEYNNGRPVIIYFYVYEHQIIKTLRYENGDGPEIIHMSEALICTFICGVELNVLNFMHIRIGGAILKGVGGDFINTCHFAKFPVNFKDTLSTSRII